LDVGGGQAALPRRAHAARIEEGDGAGCDQCTFFGGGCVFLFILKKKFKKKQSV